MKKTIIPAIIAKTQGELDAAIKKAEEIAGIAQLDIMDGKFVENTSLDFDIKLPESNLRYEAHLMVDDPDSWIENNTDKVDLILSPIETTKEPEKMIEFVKSKGKRIGFVLNPETSIEYILPYLDKIDQVLVMTVNPGFYGSPFLPEALEKARKLRELAPDMAIEVDGGISPDTIEQADAAGANLFVCGSYLMKSQDIKESFENLKSRLL